MNWERILGDRLEHQREMGSHRTLSARQGLDYSSNDYLGFCEDPTLREWIFSDSHRNLPAGSSGSRLLRGQVELFAQVEKELAEFCEAESALLFPSGYQCNLGVISALVGEGDRVYSDEKNHASMIDGIRLSRGEKVIYPHTDVVGLDELLEADRDLPGLKFIVTESIFSMDGDFAPLAELAEVAAKHKALLVVDEAHATGLWGNFKSGHGGGRVQELGLRSRVFATLHTGGKALGVGGGWVCGPEVLKEYLINFSRPFIFSTAPPPFLARCLQLALKRWQEEGPRRAKRLRSLAGTFVTELETMTGWHDLPRGPIIPIILGDNAQALKVAEQIQKKGYDVRAIRPPTVPSGSARLRVTLHWQNSVENTIELAQTIASEVKEGT